MQQQDPQQQKAFSDQIQIFYKKFFVKSLICFILLTLIRAIYRMLIGDYFTMLSQIILGIMIPVYQIMRIEKLNSSDIQLRSQILGIIFVANTIYHIFSINDNIPLKFLNVYFLENFCHFFYLFMDFRQLICFKLIQSYIYYHAILQYVEYDSLTIMTILLAQAYQIITLHDIMKYVKERINGLIQYQQIVFNQHLDQFYLLKQEINNRQQIVLTNDNTIQSLEQLKEYLSDLDLSNQILPKNCQNIIQLVNTLFEQQNDNTENHQFYVKSSRKKMNLHLLKYKNDDKNHVLLRFLDIGMQEELELMKLKDIMIASINHDLKNPIISSTYILNTIEKQYLNTGKIDEIHFQSMNFNLQFCMFLLNGYLDYTQARNGNLRIIIKSLELYSSLEKVNNLMSFSANQKNLTLYCKRNIQQLFCENDERRFQQVLMNLINNSIKFTLSNGQISIKVTEFLSNNLFYIQIIDNGIGISSKIMKNICQPYKTFNQQNMNEYGTGIGLYTSSKIVGLIGPCEKIFISSTEGVGTECSFFAYINANDQSIKNELIHFQNDLQSILSYLNQNIESITDEHIINQQINKDLILIPQIKIHQITKPINILIVDNNISHQSAIIDYIKALSQFHIQYKYSSNGLEGLKLFMINNKKKTNESFDIILTDIKMPTMDGYQMSQKIQEKIEQENYENAIIYSLSSDDSSEHYKKCQQIKFKFNYKKPFKFKDFQEIIVNFSNSVKQ